jgi:hypothetical protein
LIEAMGGLNEALRRRDQRIVIVRGPETALEWSRSGALGFGYVDVAIMAFAGDGRTPHELDVPHIGVMPDGAARWAAQRSAAMSAGASP